MDELTVHAEVMGAAYDTMDLAGGERKILKRIKDSIGVTTRVMLHGPGEVERSLTGKAKRIVDRRPKA